MLSILGNSVCRALTSSTKHKSGFAKHYHTNTNFNVKTFQLALKTRYIGRQFLYRENVTSTMAVASEEADLGASSGTIILAEEQTAGRGRAARVWVSPPKTNLYFTLILRPKDFTELPKLNFATAVAVAATARSLGIKEAGVKWPNDVLANRKKLAGILTDSSITGSSIVTRVGVGINVNHDMSKVDDVEVREVATSLASLVGKTLSREEVLACFCNELEDLLSLSFEGVLDSYRKFDLLVGQKIWVMPKKRENPERRAARVLDLAPDGNLIVELEETGEVVNLIGEEVSIRVQ